MITGYRGSDCSVDISKAPEIVTLVTPSCRLTSNRDNCTDRVTMTVTNVVLTDSVMCHVQYVKVWFLLYGSLTTTTLSGITTKK